MPLVLGKSITRTDDPLIDPANVAAPGVHDIAGADFPDYAAALCFALRQAALRGGGKPIFISQIESLAHDHGALYSPGLNWLGIDPARLVIVRTRNERDLLWSAEEALGCGELAAVIVRLPARGNKYSFTASRRLQLRSLESKTPAYVVRARQDRSATSAETLWSVAPAPSISSQYSSKRILGLARWRIALERARTSRPKEWVMDWDHATHCVNLVEPMGDRSLLSRAP